jgi:uncharacterized membrane protein
MEVNTPPLLPPPPRVYAAGVMDAVAMGWRLVTGSFGTLWLIGLLAYLAQGYLGLLGAAPYIGALVSLAVSIFVQPALTTGLVYAIRRRAEGRGVRLEDLFEGFRQRYWQSVVSILPPMGLGVFFGLVMVGVLVALGIGLGVFAGNITWDTRTAVTAAAIALGAVSPVAFLMVCALLFFVFTPVALWDHPESGWNAVRESAGLVRRHFGRVLLFSILFGAIWVAALLAGILTCCAGLIVTIPFTMVWQQAAIVYLYRSWRS